MTAFLGFGSLLSTLVFLVLGAVSAIKKNGKAKKRFMFSGMSFVLFIVMLCIPTSPSTESKPVAAKQPTAEEIAKQKADEKAKADAEAKRKADEEAKKQADEQKKAQSEANRKATVKQGILTTLKPRLDEIAKGYDSNSNAVTTIFNSLSNGSTDLYTAYNNLQTIKNNFDSYRGVNLQPVDGMTDADKKLIDDYNTNMDTAFFGKKDALDKAMKMLDSGNFSPSAMQDVQQTTATAEQFMLKATASIVTLEVTYGIK